MNTKLNALARPEPLGNRVYATLREYLKNGQIARGEPLQEAVLAEQLGVSRTPVREALLRLASEGLVTADGRGLASAVLLPEDVEEIYTLRLLLEPEAVRRVAHDRHDAAALAPIAAALADMERADAAADSAAFMDANCRFRSGWMDLLPLRRLARAIELYADHVHYLRVVTLDDAGVRRGVIERLRALFEALVAGDGNAAARCMRQHLLAAKSILIARFDAEGGAHGLSG